MTKQVDWRYRQRCKLKNDYRYDFSKRQLSNDTKRSEKFYIPSACYGASYSHVVTYRSTIDSLRLTEHDRLAIVKILAIFGIPVISCEHSREGLLLVNSDLWPQLCSVTWLLSRPVTGNLILNIPLAIWPTHRHLPPFSPPPYRANIMQMSLWLLGDLYLASIFSMAC